MTSEPLFDQPGLGRQRFDGPQRNSSNAQGDEPLFNPDDLAQAIDGPPGGAFWKDINGYGNVLTKMTFQKPSTLAAVFCPYRHSMRRQLAPEQASLNSLRPVRLRLEAGE